MTLYAESAADQIDHFADAFVCENVNDIVATGPSLCTCIYSVSPSPKKGHGKVSRKRAL